MFSFAFVCICGVYIIVMVVQLYCYMNVYCLGFLVEQPCHDI